MLTGLTLPALFLMALAVIVPRLTERWMPETLFGMALNTLCAGLLLWLCSALLFAGLYRGQDPRILGLLGHDQGLTHIATLAAKAALIWGPVLLLAIVTMPRRWKTNIW